MATPPRNQTRHKPRQSRILARRGAFRLVSQWEDRPPPADTIRHRNRPDSTTTQ
jgi:hypothetical protein